MVSFSCEACGDIFAKKKLDQHARQCRGAAFTCLDCNRTFAGSSYRDHTSCISEAQKYQGSLYRDPKANKSEKRKSMNGAGAMVPRKAHVEDAMEGDENMQQAVAIVDVPPRAPTPPEQSELPPNVNVFDFLVSEETPKGAVRREMQAQDGAARIIEERSSMPGQFPGHGMADSQYSQYSNGDGSYYQQHGFSYGHGPLGPEFARYDSYNNLIDSQDSQAALMPPPPPYVTPASKEHRKEKSDKKRKRHVEDLDLASSSVKRPSSRDEMMVDAPKSAGRVLHSGLTGGLSRLVTDKDFYDDRIEAGPTPISPIKRSRRSDDKERERKEKADRRKSSYTSYTTTTTTASKAPSSGRHADDDRHRRERSHRSHRSLSPQQSQKHSSHHRRDDDRRRIERDSFSSQDTTSRPHGKTLQRAIDYAPSERPGSVQPSSSNQLSRSNGSTSSAAELFISFVNKGPESERGYSVNKLLKRYHRERDVRGEEEKGEVDKELWRALRLRRNSRGEVVVMMD